jgi:SAM-dependent methyltransferase
VSNDEAYAAGLLNRALDPATQPREIRAFVAAEIEVLRRLTTEGMRVIDIGCGTGRHLALLRDRLALGVGVDYEHGYILEAHTRAGSRPLHFLTGDATALPIASMFDLAICMTNTWGTMGDKRGVLDEMRRVAPPDARVLSVYAAQSIPARAEWYRRLGHEVLEVTDDYILTEGGFRSEHFSEARLRELVGDCVVRPLTDIAYLVRF